jgi:signal transduction histidine kinase/CheY-like chemotaxis protein
MTTQPPRSGASAWSHSGQARTVTELRRSRAQLDLAVSAARMGAFEWNVRTQAVRLDARSREIFGFDATQGTTANEVFSRIHPADVEHIRTLALESIARGVRVDVEYRLQLPDGTLRHVASSGVMVPGSDGHTEQVLGVFADITERRWDAVRNQALVELSDRVRDLDRAQDIALAAAEVLGTTLGVGRVAYGVVVDASIGTVLVERDWTAAGVASAAGTHCLRDDGSFIDDLVRGDAVAIADARLDARTAGHAAELEARGARALLTVPLVEHGRLAAMLLLTHPTPHPWSAKEVSLVREVAERVRDIIRRKQAEQALRQADRRKDEFLATLAHELRNPLAPLRNGVELMRLNSRGDERQQHTVQMMERQLTHLVRLVDDLLDVGRISTGKVQLLLQPVQLQKILAGSIDAARPGIESRGHTLAVECVGDDLRLMADFERLSQVFFNLLSNAAKYTAPGGRIKVTVQREGAEVAVRVADTGVGILVEDLARVFDLFSQVRLHQGRAEGGLGIGLALARSLVTMHGGSVSAHSEGADRGSTFIVRLPLLLEAPPRASAPERPLSPAVPAKATGQHVLVVDDNVDAALSLGALLSALGHQVRVAHGGIEALRLAHEAMPETVFMDLGMPSMDGFEAVRRLRTMPGGPTLQVVALTGWGQPADRQRTRAGGFDAHLVKPVALAALQQLLGQPDASACDG